MPKPNSRPWRPLFATGAAGYSRRTKKVLVISAIEHLGNWSGSGGGARERADFRATRWRVALADAHEVSCACPGCEPTPQFRLKGRIRCRARHDQVVQRLAQGAAS